ncbi:MAG: hypothetical protein NZ108_03935 [Bacteroidia bacterium]|nr:hypothetical protein [Bacteroidia bacterium]
MSLSKQEQERAPVLIIGGNAEARMISEIVHFHDNIVYGYLTETSAEYQASNKELNDISVLGSLEMQPFQKMLKQDTVHYAIAAPTGKERERILAKVFLIANRLPLTAVHPQASLSPYSDLAAGNILFAGSVVSVNVRMEACNVVYPNAVIEADCKIGSFCNIGTGAVIGKGAILGNFVVIGPNAIIAPEVTIGHGTVIPAGKVVTQSTGTIDIKDTEIGWEAEKLKIGDDE